MGQEEVAQLWLLGYGTVSAGVLGKKPQLSMAAIQKLTGLPANQIQIRLKSYAPTEQAEKSGELVAAPVQKPPDLTWVTE